VSGRPRVGSRGRGPAAVAAALAVASVSAATPVRAQFPSLYPFCNEQVQIFSSLKHGDFDYCRLRLRYVPGSLECLRIVALACNGWLPEGQSWALRQGRDGFAQRIVCPPGPPPPSCPAGVPMNPAWEH
jgi:hypothetical protein